MRRAFWEYSAAEGACILDFGRKAGTMGRIPVKTSGSRGVGTPESGLSSAVLHPPPRARGPRDAEYSGICTAPLGCYLWAKATAPSKYAFDGAVYLKMLLRARRQLART